MDDSAETWVDRYRKAWSTNDPDDIRALFTEDAFYKKTPFDESAWRGHEEIVRGWLEREDQEGSWSFQHSILGKSGDLFFIHGITDYLPEGRPRFHNLWVVQLAADGRARGFTEWFMQEGQQI